MTSIIFVTCTFGRVSFMILHLATLQITTQHTIFCMRCSIVRSVLTTFSWSLFPYWFHSHQVCSISLYGHSYLIHVTCLLSTLHLTPLVFYQLLNPLSFMHCYTSSKTCLLHFFLVFTDPLYPRTISHSHTVLLSAHII